LGETSLQHPALVLAWNLDSDSLQARAFATVCKDRGWLVHKQSIFLPGRPLEAISAAISFSLDINFFGRYPGGVPLISSTWPAR
jgi:hypothetical protein